MPSDGADAPALWWAGGPLARPTRGRVQLRDPPGLVGIDGAIAFATTGGALGSFYKDGVNVTITAYDKRGQAVRTSQAQRQLSAAGAPIDLITQRATNAFGEVVSETDARGFPPTIAITPWAG